MFIVLNYVGNRMKGNERRKTKVTGDKAKQTTKRNKQTKKKKKQRETNKEKKKKKKKEKEEEAEKTRTRTRTAQARSDTSASARTYAASSSRLGPCLDAGVAAISGKSADALALARRHERPG